VRADDPPNDAGRGFAHEYGPLKFLKMRGSAAGTEDEECSYCGVMRAAVNPADCLRSADHPRREWHTIASAYGLRKSPGVRENIGANVHEPKVGDARVTVTQLSAADWADLRTVRNWSGCKTQVSETVLGRRAVRWAP